MIEEKIRFDNSESVVEKIKKDPLPIILYGAGTMALDVVDIMNENGIIISDVVVDDEFYKPDSILLDYQIKPFSLISGKYENYSVLLGRSDYSRVSEIKKHKGVDKVYFLTSPIYKMNDRLERDELKEYIDIYDETYSLLEDELSKNVFLSWINARINDDASYIFPFYKGYQTYFDNDIYKISDDCGFLDIGAFTGDTVIGFREKNKNGFIWAFEADRDNYITLRNAVEDAGILNIELYNITLWSSHLRGHFGGPPKKNQETGFVEIGGENTDIELFTIDEILRKRNYKVGLLKINFPGGDEVLKGAGDIIQNDRPYLAIRVGFNKYEIGTVPIWIRDNFPQYKIYMRYNMCIPAGLCLYAVYEE